MTRDPIIVIHPTRPGGPEGAARCLDEAIRRLHPTAVVEGTEDAIDQLRTHKDEVALVVIGPGTLAPLAAGRELRRTDESVQLAYVASPDDADGMRLQIGMLAELRPAAVIDAVSSQRLVDELRAASAAAVRRTATSRAIDAINRELVGRPRQDLRQAADSTVSESHLAAIMRHVPEAIVSVDHDHRVVALNDAAVALFGLQPGDMLDTMLQAALSRRPALQRLLDAALDGVTATGEEVEFSTGEVDLLLSVTAAPVRDHTSTVVGSVLMARDITVQRRSEDRLRQLQKAESLATLAGGVAHDFNNLLVAVRSWAQLAAEDLTDDEFVATALEKIDRSAIRAAELARSMLAYSGRGTFELEPIDVSELAWQMTDLLRGSVHRKVELSLELDDDLPLVAAGASQLRQVLLNLITNAAEAIGDSPGTITVRTRQLTRTPPAGGAELAPADRYVSVEVSDTGPGMDDETLERVFDPFFTTKFEGRGLGLAASHGIVRAHEGALTVVSEPGQGATFRMILPVHRQVPSS